MQTSDDLTLSARHLVFNTKGSQPTKFGVRMNLAQASLLSKTEVFLKKFILFLRFQRCAPEDALRTICKQQKITWSKT